MAGPFHSTRATTPPRRLLPRPVGSSCASATYSHVQLAAASQQQLQLAGTSCSSPSSSSQQGRPFLTKLTPSLALTKLYFYFFYSFIHHYIIYHLYLFMIIYLISISMPVSCLRRWSISCDAMDKCYSVDCRVVVLVCSCVCLSSSVDRAFELVGKR
jgi:hypothetical protein